MPIFRVKSVKNANFFCVNSVKIYTGAARGARDKYEVWCAVCKHLKYQIRLMTNIQKSFSFSKAARKI